MTGSQVCKFHIQLQVAEPEQKLCPLRAAQSAEEEGRGARQAKLCLLDSPNEMRHFPFWGTEYTREKGGLGLPRMNSLCVDENRNLPSDCPLALCILSFTLVHVGFFSAQVPTTSIIFMVMDIVYRLFSNFSTTQLKVSFSTFPG